MAGVLGQVPEELQLTSKGLGWRQFKAVMRKNFLVKRRHPVATLLEVFSPAVFCFMIVMFYHASRVETYPRTVYAEKFFNVEALADIVERELTSGLSSSNVNLLYETHRLISEDSLLPIPTLDEFVWAHELLSSLLGEEEVRHIGEMSHKLGQEGNYYTNLLLLGDVTISPITPETLAFRDWLREHYFKWPVVEGPMFETSEEGEAYALRKDKSRQTWAHLHFESLDRASATVEVRIRMRFQVLPHTSTLMREFAVGPGLGNKYYFSGFLTMQRAVERFALNRSHTFNMAEGGMEAFANRIIARVTGVDGVLDQIKDAADDAEDVADAVRGNGLVQQMLPADVIPDLSTEQLGQALRDLATEHILDNDMLSFLEGLPEAPRSFSLADDWSAPLPTEAWEVSEFYGLFGYLTGLLLACAVVYPVSQLLLVVTQEKEIRMKEMMKMMGLREWVFHATWLLTYAVLFVLQAIFQTLYLKQTVFANSDALLILLFTTTFNMSLISLAFLVSTFFNRAKLASMVGPVLIFSMVTPAYIFSFYPAYEYIPAKKALSLLAPSAFAFGIERISLFERNQLGATWANFDTGPISLAYTLKTLVVDFFLYGALAWYFDKVLPTKYGSHQHPGFVFRGSFWKSLFLSWYKRLCLDSRSRLRGGPATEAEGEAETKSSRRNRDDAPPPPEPLGASLISKTSIEHRLREIAAWDPAEPSIKVKNLTKAYRAARRRAVDNVSFEFMHGEVSCLLGSNGAGKSTTISVLTGLFGSSSGESTIYGDSIRTNIASARRIMGVCPQHNVLYPDLTVREHLEFFAALKGVKADYLDGEVFRIINELELVPKTHARAATLSGGQKRKLSLGMALIGHSKVVFLDEPTAGMDPQARRSMWNLILRCKGSRTIVLTTHHMEEADLLADRICIMNEGKVVCCDSPLELKREYGLGYVMHISKADPSVDKVSELMDLVVSYAPGTQLLSNAGGELALQVPASTKKQDNLVALLRKLESRRQDLNVRTYGLGMTNLEDVFLSIIDRARAKGGKARAATDSMFGLKGLRSVTADAEGASKWSSKRGDGTSLRQLRLLLWKRAKVMLRDPGSFFNELVMPIMLITSVLFVLSVSPTAAGPPVLLTAETLAPGLRQRIFVNRKSSDKTADMPDAFDFKSAAFEEDRLESPYFPEDAIVYDTDCTSSICLSYRFLQEAEKLAADRKFRDLDKKNGHIDFCAVRYDDNGFMPLNVGQILGLDEIRDDLYPLLADVLDVSVKDVGRLRVDQLLERQLQRVLGQDLEDAVQALGKVVDPGAQSLRDLITEGIAHQLNSATGGFDGMQVDPLARQINALVADILAGVGGDDVFGSAAVRAVSQEGVSGLPAVLEVGRAKEGFGFVSGLAGSGEAAIGSTLPVWQFFLPDSQVKDTRKALREIVALAEGVSGTGKLQLNETAENLRLADLAVALDKDVDELYGALACTSRVGEASLAFSFGKDFVQDRGLDVQGTGTREELCAAAKSDRQLALAILMLEEKGIGGSPEANMDKLDSYVPRKSLKDLADWLAGGESLGELFRANAAIDIDTGAILEAAFDWLPLGESATIGDALAALDTERLKQVVRDYVNSQPLLALLASFSLDTVLGVNHLNISVPTEMSTLYSTRSNHAKPMCLAQNADMQMRARAKASHAERPEAGFRVWNHPFPSSQKDNLVREIWLAFFAVLFTLVPFCYSPACYAMHATKERGSNAKHLLFVSGIKYHIYWLANLLFDFACYFVIAAWAVVVFALSDAIDFSSGGDRAEIAWGTCTVFVLYGLAAIPQAYCLSFLFNNEGMAQIVISLFNFVTGWLFVVLAVSLDIYGLTDLGGSLRPLFRVFPAFNLGEALIRITEISLTGKLLGETEDVGVYSWGVLGRNTTVLGLLIPSYFLLLVGIEAVSGNVRLNTSIEKLARSVAKFRRKRSKQSAIMPSHRGARSPLSPASPSKAEEELPEIPPDFGAIGGGAEASSVLQAKALYESERAKAREAGAGTKLQSHQPEILGTNETSKDLAGGTLRRVEGGIEFKPNSEAAGSRRRRRRGVRKSSFVFDEDKDVRAERQRILTGKDNNDLLQVRSLRKVYAGLVSGKKSMAVRSLTFGVGRGECFGLLGTNGAGKSTTMKMCTRDVFPSEGDILLDGRSIFKCDSHDVGYCPQYDALFPRLTPREHLYIYATIKGVPEAVVAEAIQHVLQKCDIEEFANQRSVGLSGGTKRKLSLAIALIGNPRLVLLDEPTAGVDPSARRRIWEIICSALHNERSIVLTTHSMEESEALCDRLCIMANGVMRCIGTPQQLKERFCPGLELEIRSHSCQECYRAIGSVQTALSTATLKEHHGPRAKLFVPADTVRLADLFATMEAHRHAWGIVSYAVSQSSLEQVFMTIASTFNAAAKAHPSKPAGPTPPPTRPPLPARQTSSRLLRALTDSLRR